jgi:hypothetical protein
MPVIKRLPKKDPRMDLLASALHENLVLFRCRGRQGPRERPQRFDETDPGYIFTSLAHIDWPARGSACGSS